MTRYIENVQASDWGMKWVRPPLYEARPDPDVVYHHVGSGGSGWVNANAYEFFRQLNRQAIAKGHAGGIDYDYAVHYNRVDDVITITEGNGRWRSAATQDWNDYGEAILLCGDYQVREPYPAELEGLARATVRAIREGLVQNPPRSMFGHRFNPAHPFNTACPGRFLIPKIDPIIIPRVKELLNPTAPPPDTTMWPTPPAPILPGQTDAQTVIPGWPTGRVSYLQTIIGIWPTTGVWDAASMTKMKSLQRIAGQPETGIYDQAIADIFVQWRGR